MKRDRDAIGRDVDIGFDMGEPEVKRVAKRSLGVLWMDARAAAVSKRDRPSDVKIRMDPRHEHTVLGYGRAHDRR